MPETSQKEKDFEFGRKALEKGCGYGKYYEDLGSQAVGILLRKRYMVSLAFVYWKGQGLQGEKKRSFVQYFHLQ